jgi:hypothetical protein
MGAAVRPAARRRRPVHRHAPGDRWFVDETYLTVNGIWRYVYRAVDQHGQVIDVLVPARRDAEADPRLDHGSDAPVDQPTKRRQRRSPPCGRALDIAGGPDAQWPTAPQSVDELSQLPVYSMIVRTDGSRVALERARTILLIAFPAVRNPPITDAEHEVDFVSTLAGWKQLANVIILASLPIAGCSLAVSIAGDLSDRRRPFSLLRLSGVQVRVLRRVLALESAVPLLLAAAVAIGAGLLTAELFLEAQLDYTLVLPGAEFWLLIGASLLVPLGVIASTLPLLERITGPETARNGWLPDDDVVQRLKP